jgi:FAD/FMN-containing dehydrogenase
MEEPFFVADSRLDKILDTVHWLIRLRLVNECLVLNNTNLALIMAAKSSEKYRQIKDVLPPWILFFNIAAYDYLPQERVSGQIKNMVELTQRLGVEAIQALGGVTAAQFLSVVKHPSAEPYWKLRHKGTRPEPVEGACQDIFFLTIFDKLPELIRTMYDSANVAAYPNDELGIYLQPIVQGVNCHCEFNLFYDSENPGEFARVRELTLNATKNLVAKGAFFSRPYGESTRMIMNRDAATMATLKKVKAIVDPNNIMNPGRLCF